MAGERVLVVDDNAANLKLARLLLHAEGYDVRTAVDAEQAQKVLAAEPHPRVILMDIQMPGMDGLELTTRLKRDPLTRDILIIALTAYAMKGDEERAHAAGCDGYVAKPLDAEQLPRFIERILAQAHRRAGEGAAP